MFTTLCVNTTDVHRAKTTHTHKDKPSILPKQTRKHDMAINMPKDDWWSIKKKGCKDSMRAHGMSLSVCNHQGEKPRKAPKLGCKPKFWTVLQPLQ